METSDVSVRVWGGAPAPKAVAQATQSALAGSRGEAPGKIFRFLKYVFIPGTQSRLCFLRRVEEAVERENHTGSTVSRRSVLVESLLFRYALRIVSRVVSVGKYHNQKTMSGLGFRRT